MFILNFLWYCLRSFFRSVCATTGHVPDGFTWKEGLTGVLTFVVILSIIAAIIIIINKKNSRH